MIKRSELGIVVVDCGDVVAMPIDALMNIWGESHKLDNADDLKQMDHWIAALGGVRCDFRCDGRYGVDRVTIVTHEYEVYGGVLMGGPAEHSLRLLRQDEHEYEEFTEPRHQSGTSIEDAFEEYAKYLRENDRASFGHQDCK